MPAETALQPADKEKRPAARHSLIIENRQSLTATGILRVLSYDETSACAQTPQGILTVGGKGLTVSEISCRSGELRVQGEIEFVQYEPDRKAKGGFFGRLAR